MHADASHAQSTVIQCPVVLRRYPLTYETGKSYINTHRLLTYPPATSKPKIEMTSLHICVHDLFFSSATILRRRLNILSTYKQKTFMPRVGCLNDKAKCKDTYRNIQKLKKCRSKFIRSSYHVLYFELMTVWASAAWCETWHVSASIHTFLAVPSLFYRALSVFTLFYTN